MVHHVCGAPLLYSSGAQDIGTPLLATLLMAHLVCGAPLLVLKRKRLKKLLAMALSTGAPLLTCFFFKTSNGAPLPGAPLVTLVTNGAFLGGAPLVTWEQLDILDSHLPHSLSPLHSLHLLLQACLGCLLLLTSFAP